MLNAVIAERNSEYANAAIVIFLNVREVSWIYIFLNVHEDSWIYIPHNFVHGLLLVHEYSWILFHELNSWLHECPIISSWVVHELFMSWSQLVQEYNSWIFLNCSWSIPNHLAGVVRYKWSIDHCTYTDTCTCSDQVYVHVAQNLFPFLSIIRIDRRI